MCIHTYLCIYVYIVCFKVIVYLLVCVGLQEADALQAADGEEHTEEEEHILHNILCIIKVRYAVYYSLSLSLHIYDNLYNVTVTCLILKK